MSDRFLDACERLLPSGAVDVTADPPVVLPPDAELTAEIVRLAAEQQIPLAITGGGTYPQPGARDGTIGLSTRGIVAEPVIDTSDFVAEVAAGTTVDNAVSAAAASGMEFPLDLFSGAAATVGGAFMTRATGGPRRIGATFPDSVLGGRFVAAPGEIVTAGGRMIKNVTGYDLTRFFAGSMGIFGIAAGLYVKLTAARESSVVLMATFPSGGDAVAALDALPDAPAPDVVELSAPDGLDAGVLVLIRYSGFAGIVENAAVSAEEIVSRFQRASVERTSVESSRAAIRPSVKAVFGAGTVAATVPPAAVSTALRSIRECCPRMPVACHVGDGRFWFRPGEGDAPGRYGPAITSIGGKRPVAWEEVRTNGVAGLYTDAERALLRTLKHELDPAGIFNPHITP